MSRALQWGCANVRDRGGVPLARGGETCYGVPVRADNIRRLTLGRLERRLAAP